MVNADDYDESDRLVGDLLATLDAMSPAEREAVRQQALIDITACQGDAADAMSHAEIQEEIRAARAERRAAYAARA